MKDQLTMEEIEHLFCFVESKNLPWKDLQYEMVDHLASSIEEEMEEHPNISFKSALNKVYGKFPITGFAMITLQKEKVLRRYWAKKTFAVALSYFKLPKVIMTLGIALIIFQLLSRFGFKGFLVIYFLGLLTILGGYLFRKRRGDFKDSGVLKNYLFANTFRLMLAGFDFQMLTIPLWAHSYFDGSMFFPDYVGIYVFTIYFSLLFMLTHAQIFEFPEMLKLEIEKKYSHLRIEIV